MKLNKKFAETILVPLSNQGFYIDWDKVEKCEQIADEFAIEFAEWCVAKNMGVSKFTLYDGELELFKKEKGL